MTIQKLSDQRETTPNLRVWLGDDDVSFQTLRRTVAIAIEDCHKYGEENPTDYVCENFYRLIEQAYKAGRKSVRRESQMRVQATRDELMRAIDTVTKSQENRLACEEP